VNRAILADPRPDDRPIIGPLGSRIPPGGGPVDATRAARHLLRIPLFVARDLWDLIVAPVFPDTGWPEGDPGQEARLRKLIGRAFDAALSVGAPSSDSGKFRFRVSVFFGFTRPLASFSIVMSWGRIDGGGAVRVLLEGEKPR